MEEEDPNPKPPNQFSLEIFSRKLLVYSEGKLKNKNDMLQLKGYVLDQIFFSSSIKYLKAVDKFSNNFYTLSIVLRIMKQKFLEAIDRCDLISGTMILEKELSWVEQFEPQTWVDLKSMIRPNYNFRLFNKFFHGHEYDVESVESMRLRLVTRIRDERAITDHPHLKDKMLLPWIRTKDLHTIYSEVVNRHEFQQPANNELLYLVRQFLEDEGINNTLRILEREKSLHFNFEHFYGLVFAGRWDDVMQYLWPLPNFDDTLVIMILKQDYLEAVNRGDVTRGVTLLKFFKDKLQEEELKNLAVLLAYANIREHPEYLGVDDDMITMRQYVAFELEREIFSNPLIKDKLFLPWYSRINLRTIYQEHKLKAARRASI